MNVVVDVKHKGTDLYVPVARQVDPEKLKSAKADTPEKQAAYVSRVLHQNADKLPIVTKDFKRYDDVRLYLGVPYDPGPDVHIHMSKDVQIQKICGRICMKNGNGKQCCAAIICPGNCRC